MRDIILTGPFQPELFYDQTKPRTLKPSVGYFTYSGECGKMVT